MKKRIFAILLSALLVANVSACNYAPENEIDGTLEDTTFSESTVEEPEETDAETPPTTWEGTIDCNGVYRDSTVMYTINQNNALTIHIKDWNEDHIVTSLSDEDIKAFGGTTKAIVLNNDYAFLFLKREDISTSKITVLKFEKNGQCETVTSLAVDNAVYKIGGNFISKNVGYLFAFKEEAGIYARGDSKLSSLFITEDGGNTWNTINVQSVPSISLSEDVIFSKMISENVGMISGRYWADDYSFCKRTLLTTDGGLNWVNITRLPQIDALSGTEVTDFIQVDDAYILTIRYETSEGNYDYAKYKLLELNTWVRIN